MTSNEARLRRFLLIVSAVILATTILELLLAEHTEKSLQFIPFCLSGAGIIAIAAFLYAPNPRVRTILRVVMIASALGGLLGIYLHVNSNIEFALEIQPAASRSDVLWDAMHGVSPLLAPGVLVLVSVLSIAAAGRDREIESRP